LPSGKSKKKPFGLSLSSTKSTDTSTVTALVKNENDVVSTEPNKSFQVFTKSNKFGHLGALLLMMVMVF